MYGTALRAISANKRARVSVVSNETLSGVYGKEPCIKKSSANGTKLALLLATLPPYISM